MLVKLLQDVAFYTNTFPKFAQVNATMSNAQVRSQGNEARLWSAVLRGSSVLVKKTKHNFDLTKGQFCELRKVSILLIDQLRGTHDCTEASPRNHGVVVPFRIQSGEHSALARGVSGRPRPRSSVLPRHVRASPSEGIHGRAHTRRDLRHGPKGTVSRHSTIPLTYAPHACSPHFKQFLGTANGVRVLHDLDIVHGDLHWVRTYSR